MIICANPGAQFEAHQEEIEDAVLNVMRSGIFILGSEVEALEVEFAEYIGTRDAVGVANGTDALELALRALEIGPGDEVITVSHTAVATVAAIEAAGATPVLVDIEPKYYTMNPSQLEDMLNERTRAVIAVHLYGQAADIDSIQQFCKTNHLALIEDVSQAHGATWKGKKLGSYGDIGCFSCYPTKNLGAIGDAGLITTNNLSLAEKVRALREYGWKKTRFISEFSGRNSRLDEIQAAILRVKLKYLMNSNSLRKKIADNYSSALSGLTNLKLPAIRQDSEHVFHLFVIQTDKRDDLMEFMHNKDVIVGVHYPTPVHLQNAYQGFIRCHEDMKVTESLKTQIMSLPIYPELDVDSQNRVIDLITDFARG